MRIFQKSLVGKVAIHYIDSLRKDKELRLFFVTILFYIALSLCVSNLTMIGVVLIYVWVIYRITTDFGLTLFVSFVAVLPFSNGKSFSLLLVPKQLVKLNVQKDIYVYASVRISDILLGAYLYLYLTRRKKISFNKTQTILISVLFVFIVIAALSFVFSLYPEGSAIDVFQLCKIFVVFLIAVTAKEYIGIMWVLAAAGVLFEGSWGAAQYIHGGRLGRYIELIPSEFNPGKLAWEQPDLLRVSGTFIDPDLFSTYLLMQIGLLVTIVRAQTLIIQKRLLVWMAIAVGIVGIVLSGNRFLYVVAAILLFPLVRTIRFRPRLVAVLGLIGIIIIPYIVIRLNGLSTVFSATGSGTFRLQMIASSLQLGLERLFGVGVGMSPVYLATKPLINAPIYGADFPHNLFMQIFAETGIIGFLLFAVFVYCAFRSFLLQKVVHVSKPLYIASLLYFVASLFYPLTFDGIEIFSFGFLYLGMALSFL